MLHAVNHGGALRVFQHIDDAFHAQQVRAAVFRQCREQQRQRHRAQRRFTHDAKTRHAAGVRVMVVLVRAAFMRKPCAYVGMFSRHIIKSAIEQHCGREGAAHGLHYLRAGVEGREPLADGNRIRAVQIGFGDDNTIRDGGLPP